MREGKLMDHGVCSAREFSVDWVGWSFLVIYGQHVNGWFCAVPNWGKGAELARPDSVTYNSGKLAEAFRDAGIGRAIAEAMCRHWQGNRKEEPDG